MPSLRTGQTVVRRQLPPAYLWLWLSTALVVLLLGALVPARAGAVASQKPVTAILQGASQYGWITDTQLRAEYTKWAAYPNVLPALRGVSKNKDEAKMVSWEASGLKYFWTTASSDYGVTAATTYAATADIPVVLARPNNLGLYYHQLLAGFASQNGWNWQAAINSANWGMLDSWATAAAAKGKKIVWNEPSHAWDEIKKNASAMNYFNKWKGTVVVTYGTNFPDQVDTWARPGALSVAGTSGSLSGVSVQGWNFRDRSVAVTSAGVTKLAKDGLDSGSTYVEFSGASADLQPGSQFLLGAQAFLSAAVPPPPDPEPQGQPFTAILSGMSEVDHKWTTEVQDRETYAKWDAKPQVRAAFRGMNYNPDDATMQRWESFGLRYYWTVASSDYEQDSGGARGIYVQADGPVRVLARKYNQGLYMHEVISRIAATKTSPLWNWEQALEKVDWGLIDRWVREARAANKEIVWSEPSHAWVALFNNKAAKAWLRSWADVVTITYATNFTDQVDSWAKPGAVALAAELGTPLGASLQSFYFHDKCNGVPVAPSAAGAQALGVAAFNAGASVFEVQGCQQDMQPASAYHAGINGFLDTLSPYTEPRALNPWTSSYRKVPLYASYSPTERDQKLSLSRSLNAGYWDAGIAGYVYNGPAPGTVPLYELRSDVNQDYAYVANGTVIENGVLKTERQSYKDSWLKYYDTGIVGYVYTEKYSDTVPLYRAWNSGEGDHAYFSARWLYDKHGQQGWEGQGSVGFLFTTDGNAAQVPLLQARSLERADHYYTTSNAEFESVASAGYTSARKAIGRVWNQPVDGAVPLYRMWSPTATDHEHTADPFQVRNDYESWLHYGAPTVIGYITKTRTNESATQLDEMFNAGSSNNYNAIDHALVTNLTDRDALFPQGYSFAESEGFVGAAPYPTSATYGGTDGIINNATDAKAFYNKYLSSREDEQARLMTQMSPTDRDWVTNYSGTYFTLEPDTQMQPAVVSEPTDENGAPIATAASADPDVCRDAHDGHLHNNDPRTRRYIKLKDPDGVWRDAIRMEFKVGFCANGSRARIWPSPAHKIQFVRANMVNGFGGLGWGAKLLTGKNEVRAETVKVNAGTSLETSYARFQQHLYVTRCTRSTSGSDFGAEVKAAVGDASVGLSWSVSDQMTTSGCDIWQDRRYNVFGLANPNKLKVAPAFGRITLFSQEDWDPFVYDEK